MPPAAGKILVIRGGAIGDFVLTLPVLSALREQFPDVRLELLGYPKVSQLALAAGLVDHVQPIDARPMASFFAKGGRLPPDLADYFGSFALIISYLFDPDGIFQENVARSSKAQFIAGPHRPIEADRLHATEVFLRPLERLAIFAPDPTPRLRLVSGTADVPVLLDGSTQPGSPAPDALPGDQWLAVHPGSGSERKNWPEQSWAALLQRLSLETSLCFLLVGGEVEGDRLCRLGSALPPDRFKIVQSVPLPELALLLQQCRAYLGHDSGITHLAAALGLRGVVLWADTSQEVWRPRSDRFHLLASAAGLALLEPERVLAAFRATLDA